MDDHGEEVPSVHQGLLKRVQRFIFVVTGLTDGGNGLTANWSLVAVPSYAQLTTQRPLTHAQYKWQEAE